MEDNGSGDVVPLVPCHLTPNTGSWMTQRELYALHCCKHDILSSIQPMLIASALRRHGVLKETLYSSIKCMFAQGIEREILSEFLVANLSSCMNLEYFVQVLDECGYRKLACQIFLKYITGRISYIHKSTSGQRPLVHKFFRNLKRMVHDAQFENPRLALRQLAERFVNQMQNERNQTTRQLLADKCIAIIGAEIDAIAITFDPRLHEHNVFTQMKQLVTETSNTSITDVVYLGRLANANSIAGNFNNSEDILVEARCRAYYTGPCLELVNMLYIEVYVKLWEFEKFPSEKLRKQLMMWGRVGLESLESEDVDTKTLWRRMFILRMVFCLIGIGNRANIIENCPIDEECLSQADDLLSDIDRTWYGIETRRKMFYFVARGRLSELKGHPTECIEYIKEARKLANEGHFEELIFIVEYYEWIINRTKSQTVMEYHTIQSGNLVPLRKETKCYSNDHCACILTSADESRNFVLVQTLSETIFSAEDRFHMFNEAHSSNFPIANQSTYSPAAFDHSRNVLLLKSLEVERHQDSYHNNRNIESSTIFHELKHEPPEQCLFKESDERLHHLVQECSNLPHDHAFKTPSFHQASGMKINLYHTRHQVNVEEQLVLTDLQNPSHNYVLINAENCNSDQCNFEMSPRNEDLLAELSPLNLSLSSPVQNHVEEISGRISSLKLNTTSCNQRLNVLFGESNIDSSNRESTEELFSLIPPNACQGLQRYFLLQPGVSIPPDRLLEERPEPIGCSDEHLSDIRTGTDIDKFHKDKISVGNTEQTCYNRKSDSVVDHAGNSAGEWSFQSDDMFGD